MVARSCRHGAEDRPGRVKQNRHQRDGILLAECLGVDHEKHRRRVDGLVVECREELRDQKADEAARPDSCGSLGRRGQGRGERRTHRGGRLGTGR